MNISTKVTTEKKITSNGVTLKIIEEEDNKRYIIDLEDYRNNMLFLNREQIINLRSVLNDYLENESVTDKSSSR